MTKRISTEAIRKPPASDASEENSDLTPCMVVHRSMMLGKGTLPKRAAYVMRFVDARSIHDDSRR